MDISKYFEIQMTSEINNDSPKSFSDIYEAARYFQALADGLNSDLVLAGQENFQDFARKLLVGFINTLGHIVNTFKTNILKSFKNVKRSELRYYHESNMLSVKRILNRDYYSLINEEIDFPDGMSVSYLEATNSLEKFLQFLDMMNRIKAIETHVNQITNNILSSKDLNDTINTTTRQIDFQLIDLVKQFKVVNSCFKDTKHVKRKTFSKLFKTPNDMKEVDEKLLSMEHHFQDVNVVYSSLQQIESQFDNILSALDEKKIQDINQISLKSLAGYCASIARLCDMYGYSITDLQRLEHNLCKVYDQFKN